ncbi:secreted RxLR effector protein 78-like [Cryptomeria japonica]|uniref:secreted RxLR effector protein 78-like n=1 Tax=Cryptomeria japonica TaxID=3369 RepID=UPI0027D9FC13|nr:secreted RxLR effector protein 78-like [Cryptomeria japonica]
MLAKILATRLEKLLPRFIYPTQTGFIKGRYILENLITSWEAMEWARTSNQDAAMFLFDYEKAYDRVEWEFIIMMLESFGFLGEFCQIVKVLLHDASAQIDINGSLSTPIVLSRSIRQGCPLAPSLFVIASDALF